MSSSYMTTFDLIYEYFDNREEIHENSQGAYGGKNFSWSAALLIDLLSFKNQNE